MKLKIVCPDLKYLPQYANETDACMDLKIRVEDEQHGLIAPGMSKKYGTGVQFSIPEDYVMLIFPRSSTGFKLNCMLGNTTGIIDTGYRDEVMLSLHNFGDKAVQLQDGQRVAQFMIIPRPKLELVHVEDDDEFRNGDRGGGIGSSGK